MINSERPEIAARPQPGRGDGSADARRRDTAGLRPRRHVIRVVVADLRPLIAEALAALLDSRQEFDVVSVIDSTAAAEEIPARDADVVLVGVGAEPEPGIELVRALRAHLPSVRIVLVADRLEPDLVKDVLENALGGLLLTDSPAGDVATCLDQVAQGRAVLPPGWQKALADGRNNPLAVLSNRQLQVLELLADGYSYEEIAKRLFISLNTVKFHVRSIFLRLGVRNRMAAARLLVGRH